MAYDSGSQTQVLSCSLAKWWLPPQRLLGNLPSYQLLAYYGLSHCQEKWQEFLCSSWMIFWEISLFCLQVPRSFILFFMKLNLSKLTLFREIQATYLKSEVIAVNICTKWKHRKSFNYKTQTRGWNYSISMKKKKKIFKPHCLIIFKFRNWQGNNLTSFTWKDRGPFLY